MNLLSFTFVLPVHSPIADQYQRPLFESMVSAGFPSPAQDYYDGYLNLHQYLIPDPNNVFFVRANGDSMTGAGIFDQDLLIVDRSKKKPNGKVVIASLNGEFTLKRLVQTREYLSYSRRIQTMTAFPFQLMMIFKFGERYGMLFISFRKLSRGN